MILAVGLIVSLSLQVYSIVHGVVRVELIVTKAMNEINVNRELIRMNFADEADESQKSFVCCVSIYSP